MKRFILILSISFSLICSLSLSAVAQMPAEGYTVQSNIATLRGEVVSAEDGSAVQFATIAVVDNNRYACVSDAEGRFELRLPTGEQRLAISSVGFDPQERLVVVSNNPHQRVRIQLGKSELSIDKVVVRSESQSSRVNRTAFNVQSIEIGDMKNSSANITQAMAKMSGVKLRESGGVGSDTQLNINGFNGSHVKIFIDGIPQNGNAAFSLNNIPAGFAERIEVYSGVVPIEFGADALGGVVNIITNKANNTNRFNLDASYSYGSFNTHKTYLNVGQTLKNGFSYSINAYQNYSDNNYWVDNYITYFDVLPNGSPTSWFDANDIQRVQRFHDTYHNETIIGSIGFANTSWADFLTLKLNYSQFYKDIQTGTTQNQVYGEKYTEGYTLTPTLEYSKRNLFTEGFDLRFSANYDAGYTHNADPSTYSYNWLGDKVNTNLATSDNESRNYNWGTNLVAKYVVPNRKHNITLSNTVTSSSRITRSLISGSDLYSDYDDPQMSIKSISGLSYMTRPVEQFEGTAFVKHFLQANEGTVEDADTGLSSYEMRTNSEFGYGAAATYFVLPQRLQAKLSYERAYRLPTSTEMFGDTDLETGTFDLNPETSDNINLNLVYTQNFNNKHYVRLDGSLIYRNTHDYIIRSASSDGTSASYSNFGEVETQGFSIIARYDYDRYFSIGGTFNSLNARDAEEFVGENSQQVNMTYGVRMPNQPYLYGSGDATLNLYGIFKKHDQLSVIYDIFYQHEFPLYFETFGYADSKHMVPTQLSHSLIVNYSFRNNRYNFSFECRNITDADLYDNYSLQKAGRAFYGKFRVNIFK